jgi:hypothetical protein
VVRSSANRVRDSDERAKRTVQSLRAKSLRANDAKAECGNHSAPNVSRRVADRPAHHAIVRAGSSRWISYHRPTT